MMEHMFLAETFEARQREQRALAGRGSRRQETVSLGRVATALLRSAAGRLGRRDRSAILTGYARGSQCDGDAEVIGSKPAERGRVGAFQPCARKYVVDTLNRLP